MTDGLNWEKVDVPRGAYIGWGLRPGQKVVGKVVEYAPTGGRDFNENVCPALAIELVEEAWSADKAQNWTKHNPGDLVQLNCGQVSLKRAVHTADPKPGDLVKIELENILAGAGKQGGDVKEFGIQIVRGFAPVTPRSAPQQQPQPSYGGGPQPSFGAAPQQPQGPQFNGGPQAPMNYPPQPQAQPGFGGASAPDPAYAAQQQAGASWGPPAPTAPPAGPGFGTGTEPPPF